MGKAGAGDAPNVMIVCGLPIHVVVDLLRQWVDEVRRSYAEQSKVALTFTALWLMYRLELADFTPPPIPAAVVQLPVA